METMAEKSERINTRIAKSQEKLSFHMKKNGCQTIGWRFDKAKFL
ncbi:conserved hypothetical protein [delta proteobacterium NaphS2]|nr:conserved hypothetical protein [delta proteobacterium NaphS2]